MPDLDIDADADLSQLKLADLTDLANRLGLGSARLRKRELIDLLDNYRRDHGSLDVAVDAPTTSSADAGVADAAQADEGYVASQGYSAAADIGYAPEREDRAGGNRRPTTPRIDGAEQPMTRLSRRATAASGAAPRVQTRHSDAHGPSPAEREAARADLQAEIAAAIEAGVPPTTAGNTRSWSVRGTDTSDPGRRVGGEHRAYPEPDHGVGRYEPEPTRPDPGDDGPYDNYESVAGPVARSSDSDNRRTNGRLRDRKRRSAYDDAEPEILDEDVLIPIGGILDILDNYAFVRTSGYLAGPSDVYVSLAQVRKYNFRKGDAIIGAVRQPRESEGNSRQKFNALIRVDQINGQAIEDAQRRVEFQKLTPLYPTERLRLETEPKNFTTRTIDLIAPIGKGQRGLIVAPPKAGKTLVLQNIANAITTNNPEVHLMVVLVDERPEEVTDVQRTVKGEVIASTFDRPADDHTSLAELAIERAKRLVELGHDVVVLLDSLTRLGRAYNTSAPASGRVLSGGVDATALYPPKRFFGAARNIENGGSLTVIATALVETGSKMDEVIFEEFKGTGNSELRLSRSLADKRIFPAVDVNASSTRREEMLLSEEEMAITWGLRRALAGLDQQTALELVLGRMQDTASNAELLVQLRRSMPGASSRPAAVGANRDDNL